MNKVERKTNPVLQETIRSCEEAARRNDAAIWQRVADELQRANRQQREVTVSDIERHTEDGDTVVVPGKVVGRGRISNEVTVIAFDYTQSAMDAIAEHGDVQYIDEAVETYPDGSGLKLLG